MAAETSPLDLSRPFLPEALAGLAAVRALDAADRRRMNQIGAASYLHVFDLLETCIADAARAHAVRDVDERDVLAPLLGLDTFDHGELFHAFERSFRAAFPVAPRLVPRPADLDAILAAATPLSLLVVALHLKLVTQQHYLACVRGDERLEPRFVRLLREHWTVECGRDLSRDSAARNTALALQQAISAAPAGRVPSALRDYRRVVFVVDDVLRRQAELDVATLDEARGARLPAADREALLAAQVVAHRTTFLSLGIVNAAFVYALRGLGPMAPAALAGTVSALAHR